LVDLLDVAHRSVQQPSPCRAHLPCPCSLLYELLTNEAFVASATPIMVVCNKMDQPGARSVEAVRGILEEEL